MDIRMRRSRWPGRRELWSVLLSLIIGFAVATWLRIQLVPTGAITGPGGRTCSLTGAANSDLSQITPEPPDPPKNIMYVGVMTAQKFLRSRAVAVNRTWARTIPGRVNFFSSGGSASLVQDLNLPIVSLRGVDDSYPPQKKSFMMLKYMHDNFIDKYEWFMRTDDDVYVRGDKLGTFLRSLNSSQTLFIGQAGLGKVEEVGLLNLDQGENFCMGGPGMIFSRETLKKIAPHISYCLKNLWSTHEDVEVGRCVKKFAEVDCTWSYEMQSLFYNNYSRSDVAFTGNLQTPEVHKAITLHPIKKPPYLYRLHDYLHTVKIADLRLKTIQHYREIREMKLLLNEDLDEPPMRKVDAEVRTLGLPTGLMKYSADGYEDVIPWQFFAKYLYQGKSDSPRRGISKPLQAALEDIVMQVMSIINSNSMKIGRTIDYKEILYGYSRVVPQFGADYVLDLLLMYNKHKGKSRRLPVRRHAYLQQAFGKIEFRDDNYDDSLLNEGPSSGGYQNSLALFGNKPNNIDSLMSRALPSYTLTETIHFVLPLAGRFEIFQRFMQNFERTCLTPGEKVKLVVVLFKIAEDDPSDQIVSLVEGYQAKYPSVELKVLRAIGEFSRGLALDLGASQFPKDALLFFVDVDMYLTPGFLTRCRANTKRQEQVYYPVVFSQYNPDYVYGPEERTTSKLAVSKEAGFFRHYGFGIVCLYNSDLSTVGGMDSSIIGWGMEDVDLYQKFVASNITVFRAPDPALVHIYHTVLCDPNLEAKQYQMCLGSKASTYGSSMQLAKEVEEIKKQQKEDENIAEDPKR